MLFADYIEYVWLPSKKSVVEKITYSEYTREVREIAGYFRERKIILAELSIRHIEDFYDALRMKLSECTVQKYHTKIHSALRKAETDKI